MTRRKGTGTVYQRKDGLWVAAYELGLVDGKRRKFVKTSRDRAVVEKILDEYLATIPEPRDLRPRAEAMAAARALGRHTDAEVEALIDATTECRYCRVELSAHNRVEDHRVPVSRGGSDAIDNIDIICWECNAEKRDLLHYSYGGPPRRVSTAPWRRGIDNDPLSPEKVARALRRLRNHAW